MNKGKLVMLLVCGIVGASRAQLTEEQVTLLDDLTKTQQSMFQRLATTFSALKKDQRRGCTRPEYKKQASLWKMILIREEYQKQIKQFYIQVQTQMKALGLPEEEWADLRDLLEIIESSFCFGKIPNDSTAS